VKKTFESVLTIDDLAEYLQISKSTLYKLAQESKIPGQKVGRHWRFRKETIDRWLDRDEVESAVGTGGKRKKRKKRK
jgi:excisionase family DNA binding protein